MDWWRRSLRYSELFRRTLNNLSQITRTLGRRRLALVQWYVGLTLIVLAVGCWSVPFAMLLVGTLLVLNAIYS